jgi:hypothetical protein
MATKFKLAPSVSPTWNNQVIRTADGRLLVRGVDVPATGKAWDRLVAGKIPLNTTLSPEIFNRHLLVVTKKRKALSIAKKAGLVPSVKSKVVKK